MNTALMLLWISIALSSVSNVLAACTPSSSSDDEETEVAPPPVPPQRPVPLNPKFLPPPGYQPRVYVAGRRHPRRKP